jgi:hypothetical protein
MSFFIKIVGFISDLKKIVKWTIKKNMRVKEGISIFFKCFTLPHFLWNLAALFPIDGFPFDIATKYSQKYQGFFTTANCLPEKDFLKNVASKINRKEWKTRQMEQKKPGCIIKTIYGWEINCVCAQRKKWFYEAHKWLLRRFQFTHIRTKSPSNQDNRSKARREVKI